MTHRMRAAALVVGVSILLASGPSFARRILATSADDVCAPDADPCVIETGVVVRDGTVLDFGTRTVIVSGRGKLRFHGEANRISCGSFLVQTEGRNTIRLRKGETPAAVITIAARRECSDASTPCLADADCASGSCSVGSGVIDVAANVRITFAEHTLLELVAAGDVHLLGKVTEAGVALPSLRLASTFGDVTVDSQMFFGSGVPEVRYTSGSGSIQVAGRTTLRTNYHEKSRFEVLAGADVTLDADVDVSSGIEGGPGGDIVVAAGGELRIEGGTASLPRRLVAGGSAGGIPGESGAGGRIELGGGNVFIGANVEIDASASSTRGPGGVVVVSADSGAVNVDGRVRAAGEESMVEISAAHDVDLAATSSLSVRAHADAETGALQVVSLDGDVRLAGTAIVVGGTPSPMLHGLDVEGCAVVFASGAATSALDAAASASVRARESLLVEAGATVNGWSGGVELRYRSGTPAPVVHGAVSPAPSLVEDGSLAPCSP